MNEPAVIDAFVLGGPYGFLSNFHLFGGTTVEHHFQAAKTTDLTWATRILCAPTPGEAKTIGRQAPLRPGWEEHLRVPVMETLLRWKFKNVVLADQLRATGEAMLIEGNDWHDTFWGECTGRGRRCNGHAPEGDNYLGRLLMDVRTILTLAEKASQP